MADKPHSIGSAEAGMETSAPVKAMGARAEADLIVRRLLGIDLSTVDLRDETRREGFSRNVVTHIFNEIRRTRVAIAQDELERDFDRSLEHALKIYDVDQKRNLTLNDNAHIVATALFEVLPKDVSRELLSQRFEFTSERNAIGEVQAAVDFGPAPAGSPIGGTMNVTIDMTNSFWSTERFHDAAELADALDKKKVSDVGISIASVGRNESLNSAQALAIAQSAVGGWRINRLRGQYAQGREAITLPTGERLSWFIDLDHLVTAGRYAPPGGVARRFALMNLGELANALRDPACWSAVVRAPTGVPNTWTVRPGDPAPFGTGQWADYIARSIFEKLGRPATGRLGIAGLQEFHQFQHRQAQLHQVYSRAQQSENTLGAAATAAILSADSTLAERFPTLEKTRAEDLKKEIERIQYAQKQLDALKELKADVASIPQDYDATVTSMNRLATTKPASPSRDDIAAHANELNQRTAEVKQYALIDSALQKLFNALNAAGLDGTKMGRYMSTVPTAGGTATIVNKSSIDNTFNAGLVAAEIERDVDLAGAIKKKESEMKEAEAGEFSADALQQKVFAEYLKRQNPGLSEDDAEKGAKYIFARTLSDGAVQQDIESITHDLFGEEKEEGWVKGESLKQKKRDIDVINGVARAVGVTAFEPENWFQARGPSVRRLNANERYNNARSPEWSRASYRQLCTAYFALKQVYDDPSHRLHLGRWKFVKEQMETITKLLSTRYVQALVDDYGGNIDPEERKKLKQGKTATAATIEQMLSGEPPERYKGKIEKVLKDVEAKMYWKSNVLKNIWGKTGANVPWKTVGKGVTAPVWWPAGKAIGLTGKGIGLVTKHPWMTAGFVAGSILAGPIAAGLALAVANRVGGGGGGGSHPN